MRAKSYFDNYQGGTELTNCGLIGLVVGARTGQILDNNGEIYQDSEVTTYQEIQKPRKFEDKNFRNLDLRRLEIKGSVFESCTFYHSEYVGSKFISVELVESNFSKSNGVDVEFEQCVSYSMILTGSDLSNAKITKSTFIDAGISRVYLDCSEITDCHFLNSYFVASSITSSKIHNCNFVNANMFDADFSHTKISNCGLTDWSFATIENCDFTGADLKNAMYNKHTKGLENFTKEQLETMTLRI